MKTFLFKGYKIRYVEAGAGEPLVFLHNGGNDHQIWEHQIAHFSHTHRVIAPDYLGFGESDKPHIELTLPLYSELVGAFIEGLGLSPVTLIGNCMGAAMSFDYALYHPGNVRRLILFNIASEKHLLAGPLGKVYRNFHRHHWLRALAGWKADRFGFPRKETDKLLRSQYGKQPPEDTEFAAYIHELYNRKGQQRSLYVALSNFDTFKAADAFSLPANFPPVCVIWGAENFILPASAGQEFCQRLRPHTQHFLADAGHLPMREQAAEVNRLLDEFLAKTGREVLLPVTV